MKSKLPFSLPQRSPYSHKGQNGRLLVFAGSLEMPGAAALSAEAAYRMGVGLVQIMAKENILPVILLQCKEAIGFCLSLKTKKTLNELIKKSDALILGPGLGTKKQTAQWLSLFIKSKKPMVIDADALNILARQKKWPKILPQTTVLTPHPGEMERLLNVFKEKPLSKNFEKKAQAIKEFAKKINQVIVLKGYQTIVTDGEKIYINRTGNDSLAKAGTGDVLSGIIGALLSQKISPYSAACIGVYLHGLAGEQAGKELGTRSVLAHDVIFQIPKILRKIK